MRTRELLRLAAACAIGVAATVSFASSASAFTGLSDRQQAHVEEYIHCKILLFTDIQAFEDDPACGGTPNVDLKSAAGSSEDKPLVECYSRYLKSYDCEPWPE